MKYLDIPVALCLAVTSAYWVDLDIWTAVSVELVALLTLLGMGALTAMVVMLTVKSPDEMNVGEARSIGASWHGLVLRLTAVLCCALGGALTVITSRILLGKTILTFETAEVIIREDFQWAFSGLIAFFGVMALTRLIAVLRGVSNLSTVNRELVVKGVLRQQARIADESGGRVETLKLPGDTERLFNR